jgi:hypothetical protein
MWPRRAAAAAARAREKTRLSFEKWRGRPHGGARPIMAPVLLIRPSTPSMLRRLCAWSLLLLALSPFTAPFSTCDIGTLLGRAANPAQGAARRDGNVTAGMPLTGAEAMNVSAFRPQAGFARTKAFSVATRASAAASSRRANALTHPRGDAARQSLGRAAILRI